MVVYDFTWRCTKNVLPRWQTIKANYEAQKIIIDDKINDRHDIISIY